MKSQMLVIPAAAVLILVSCNSQEPVTLKKRMINPPLPSLDPGFEKFTVDAGKDTTITVPNTLGTVISYRANSLTDSAGMLVKGNVEFRYREFHDAYSTVLSGIPMSCEKNGKWESFETAGMFELRAEQKGKALFIRNESSVGVKFAGKTSGDDFSFYYLDEEKGWNQLGLNPAEENIEKAAARKVVRRKKKELSPIPFGKDHFILNYLAALDIYFGEDQKLIRKNYESAHTRKKIRDYGLQWIPAYSWKEVVYKGVPYPSMMLVWKNLSGQPLPSGPDYLDISLDSLGNNIYQLTLSDQKGKKTVLKVQPVLPLQHLFAFSAQQWRTKYEENMQLVMEEEKRVEKMAEVFRFYKVNNFGIYNYDKFLKNEEAVTVKAEFRFDSPAPLSGDFEIYCVMNEGRGLVKTRYSDRGRFTFLRRGDMRLFTLLPPNRLVVFPPERTFQVYDEINSGGLKEYEFNMPTKTLLKSTSDLELALK
jgi:hypothetical protein